MAPKRSISSGAPERVIVETDGFQTHGHRAAFESDRVRDAHLQSLGFRVLRFTWRQVTDGPKELAATLGAVLRLA